MGKKDEYHQKLNSLNPAWCLLQALPTKVAAAAGNTTTPRNNPNTSSSPPSAATSRPTKKSSTAPRRPLHSPKAAPDDVAEPTSPRVGCMGQIRRRKPPPATSKSSSSSSSSAASPPADGSNIGMGLSRWDNMRRGFSTLARVETVEGMDPPRPVGERKEEAGAASLWKRRCGGSPGEGGGPGLRLPIGPALSECTECIRSGTHSDVNC